MAVNSLLSSGWMAAALLFFALLSPARGYRGITRGVGNGLRSLQTTARSARKQLSQKRRTGVAPTRIGLGRSRAQRRRTMHSGRSSFERSGIARLLGYQGRSRKAARVMAENPDRGEQMSASQTEEQGLWEYRFAEDCPYPGIAVRRDPDFSSPKIGPILVPNSDERIKVTSRVIGEDGNLYLKLGANQGWVCAKDPRDLSIDLLIDYEAYELRVASGVLFEALMIDPLLLDKKDLMMGSSSAESTSKEELIDYILSLRSRHKNGVGMDSEDRERVAEMAAALAQLNPQPIPANSAKNDGNWTLIYTTTEEQASGKVTLDGLLGTFEVPVVGDVNQFIDFRSKTYTNTISSQPWFRATLEAEFAVLDAHTWKIKFTRFMSQGFGGRKVQDLKLGGEDDVGVLMDDCDTDAGREKR